MSYEPSHRKPPRQERWPSATPGEGWPAYQQGDGGRDWEPAEAFAGSRNGYGDTWSGRGPAAEGHGDAWGGAGYGDPGQGYWADRNGYGGTTTAYPVAGDGYAADGYPGDGYGSGYADGFDGAADGYGSSYRDAAGGYVSAGGNREAAGGYREAAGGYGAACGYGAAGGYGAAEDYYEAPNGWDGHGQPGHEFTGSAGYLAQDQYPALDPASSVLVAPDTLGEWWRQPDRSQAGGRDQASRGPVVGAVTGLLAAAVAIGVATLAAAFVRPQASPVSAVGDVLIGRLPATLRSHLTAHFGAHAQALLLLGAIGLAAMVFGCVARRNASLGVAGIAALGLLGAFVAITRPESRPSDVVPWAIGGLAGILALLWLAWASAPTPEVASLRPGYSGGGRRAR